MTPQTKQLKGYKSKRCMNCCHAEKISSTEVRCDVDKKFHWKDFSCGSFDYSEDCFEQSTEQPIAYEFHNLTTGHCYVDYVPRIDMDEKGGYTKTPLYK